MGAIVSNVVAVDETTNVKLSFELVFFAFLESENRMALRHFLSVEYCRFMKELIATICMHKLNRTDIDSLAKDLGVRGIGEIASFYVERANLYATIKLMINPLFQHSGPLFFRDKLDVLKASVFWEKFASSSSSSSSSSSYSSSSSSSFADLWYLHAKISAAERAEAMTYGVQLSQLFREICSPSFTKPDMLPFRMQTEKTILDMCVMLATLEKDKEHITRVLDECRKFSLNAS